MWTHVLLSLLLVGVGHSLTVDNCPKILERDDNLKVLDDKCYYFHINFKREFKDAQIVCQRDGGILATIKSKKIQDFVFSVLKESYHYEKKVWIGLHDEDKEGDYVWVDGSKLQYQNFDEGEGTKRNGSFWDGHFSATDCIAMDMSSGGKWKEVRCNDITFYNHHEAFVCEFPANPTTPPTTDVATHTKNDCPASLPRDQSLKVFENKCYYFYLQDEAEFAEAREKCKRNGGNLVSIKSQKTENFIWSKLETLLQPGDRLWIGLSDEKQENTFVWEDGSEMEYNNFASGYGPSFHFLRAYEDCVAIDANDGKWYDFSCSVGLILGRRMKYICEYPVTAREGNTTTASTVITVTSSTTKATTVTDTNTKPATTATDESTTTNAPTTTTPPTTTTTDAPNTTTPPTTTTAETPATTTPPTTTTTEAPNTTTPPTTTTTETPTTTTPPTSTTTEAPNTTTPPTTTTTEIPTTTTPPTTHPSSTTPKQPTTTEAKCPTIKCNLDCGMDGYQTNPNTGCMMCVCAL